MILVLVGMSLVFSLIFHLGTKEPPVELDKRTSTTSNTEDVKVRKNVVVSVPFCCGNCDKETNAHKKTEEGNIKMIICCRKQTSPVDRVYALYIIINLSDNFTSLV